MGNFDRKNFGNVYDFYKSLKFNSDWITKGADQEMIEFSEKAGDYMAPCGITDKDRKYDKQSLSKSQIRNVYGEIKRIQFKNNKPILIIKNSKVKAFEFFICGTQKLF